MRDGAAMRLQVAMPLLVMVHRVSCSAAETIYAVQAETLPSASPSPAPHRFRYLYFLAGQSNMLGRGNGSALSDELLERLDSLGSISGPDAPMSFWASGLAGGASTSYANRSCEMGYEHHHSVLSPDSVDFLPVERLPLAPGSPQRPYCVSIRSTRLPLDSRDSHPWHSHPWQSRLAFGRNLCISWTPISDRSSHSVSHCTSSTQSGKSCCPSAPFRAPPSQTIGRLAATGTGPSWMT